MPKQRVNIEACKAIIAGKTVKFECYKKTETTSAQYLHSTLYFAIKETPTRGRALLVSDKPTVLPEESEIVVANFDQALTEAEIMWGLAIKGRLARMNLSEHFITIPEDESEGSYSPSMESITATGEQKFALHSYSETLAMLVAEIFGDASTLERYKARYMPVGEGGQIELLNVIIEHAQQFQNKYEGHFFDGDFYDKIDEYIIEKMK